MRSGLQLRCPYCGKLMPRNEYYSDEYYCFDCSIVFDADGKPHIGHFNIQGTDDQTMGAVIEKITKALFQIRNAPKV